jgi:Putative MetA-pathway of phenol degradation
VNVNQVPSQRVASVLLITLLLGAGTGLWAGPPFRTDDPEPVALGHAEFYLALMGTRTPDGQVMTAPLLEFNYGILPNLQFHIVAPYAQVRASGESWSRGYGDTEIGLKYRFIEEHDGLPQVGIFPMIELPTGNAERGLGSGHTAVYLPLWLQKGFGKWTTYGGYGWWRNPGEGQRNWTYAGWLLQRELSEGLTLGGEVFRATASTLDGRASVGYNLGAIVNLSEQHHLLVSLGKNLSGPAETHWYIGYQFTFAPGTSTLKGLGPAFHPPTAR